MTASTADKAAALRDLHLAPALLQVVNVWDVASARVVADLPGTKALATASHSIAATFGYPDGLRPLADAVHAVEAVVSAGEDEGVSFALNARTDAFLRAGSPAEQLATAVERGRAYLDAGATCIFVPGRLTAETIGELVEGIGDRRVSVIGIPGGPRPAELEALGVARISYGPQTQRVALAALQATATDLLAGGGLPDGIPALN